MQKQRRHHLRVERRLAEPARVAAGDLAQIKALSDDGNNQPGQVVLSQVILNARRQQMPLVNLPWPKMLAHGHAKNQTRRNLARCFVPDFDGAFLSRDSKDALWDRFYTGAPRRQRRSVERYILSREPEGACETLRRQPEDGR